MNLTALFLAASLALPVPQAVLDALMWHESRGIASATNRYGCVGLYQICPASLPVCRGPEGVAAPACGAKLAALLDPAENTRTAIEQLAGWRSYCLRTVHRARIVDILSGYGGYDGPGRTCGHVRRGGRWVPGPVPRGVLEVLRRAAQHPVRR